MMRRSTKTILSWPNLRKSYVINYVEKVIGERNDLSFIVKFFKTKGLSTTFYFKQRGYFFKIKENIITNS